METVRCLKWLEETYPDIDDWNVLYEKHQFEYSSEVYDPYTFQRRGQYIPRRTVVLETEQSEQFDRLFIDSSVWCDVFFVNDSNTDNDMYYPREVLTATVSHGWEKDWQLENYADVTVGMPSEYASPYLWNTQNKRAVLIDDGKSYPIGTVDEEPWGLRSAIYNKAQPGAGNWYMELMKDDQVKAAYYNDNSQQLAVFEQSENSSQLLIESERLILQSRDKILFYDIGDHFSVKPVKVIGGDGNGLSDKSIEIRSICAENDDCSEFAIFYHCLDENEWHICSFNQYGEIRSNFNTGLAVVKDMIHFEGCYIKDGILYFRYYPNGMGYRDPYTDYEVNLREASIMPTVSPTNYHFVLGDSKEGKILAVGDEIGSWKLDNLEISHSNDGQLHHVFADFSGEVTLEGTIVRNGMMENGYDFIVKESDRFFLPKISEGREVNRVYINISEEMKAALNLDFGEELPARITINEYNYRFAYTEAMNSVAVTNLLPMGENLTDEQLIQRMLWLNSAPNDPAPWWFCGSGGTSSLNVDYNTRLDVDEEEAEFYLCTRFGSLEELKAYTEQIYTRDCAEKILYTNMDYRGWDLFREHNGQLYINDYFLQSLGWIASAKARIVERTDNNVKMDVWYYLPDGSVDETSFTVEMKLEDGQWKLHSTPITDNYMDLAHFNISMKSDDLVLMASPLVSHGAYVTVDENEVISIGSVSKTMEGLGMQPKTPEEDDDIVSVKDIITGPWRGQCIHFQWIYGDGKVNNVLHYYLTNGEYYVHVFAHPLHGIGIGTQTELFQQCLSTLEISSKWE